MQLPSPISRFHTADIFPRFFFVREKKSITLIGLLYSFNKAATIVVLNKV